jgi:replicative DNA helicase
MKLQEWIDEVEPQPEPGLLTGLASFDEMTAGLDGLMLLTGNARCGKVEFALQLAYGVLQENPVLWFSSMMDYSAVYGMLLAQLSGLSYPEVLKLKSEKNPSLAQPVQSLKKISERFYVKCWFEQVWDHEAMEAELRRVQKEHKTQQVLVVVDNIQYINSYRIFETDEKNARDCIISLYQIADRTGAVIGVSSQNIEPGTNMIQILAALEPSEPETASSQSRGYILHVKKNLLHYPPGMIPLIYNPVCYKFSEAEKISIKGENNL